MRRVLADTSALYALMVATDNAHRSAVKVFRQLQKEQAALVTTSYVLVETYALLARRCGLEAVKAFRTDFAPLVDVAWLTVDQHERALDLLIKRHSRDLSLVDAASFVVMREMRIDIVFAFDAHFEEEGFKSLS